MKKFYFPIILAILPLIANAAPVEIDGIWYNIIPKGKVAAVTWCQSGNYSGVIDIPETVTYNGIECNVTNIENEAFKYNHNITSVKLPDNLTSIGTDAFYNCSGLISITIGNNVTTIGTNAFYACNAMKAVYIKDLEAWFKIIFSNAYSNPLCCAKRIYLNNSEITELIVPTGLTSIGKNTFINCSSLVSLSIPNSVNKIGAYAFSGCTGLTSIIIPNSVSSIGDNAFSYCTGVTSIVIGSGLSSYGSSAFANCPELENVTLLALSIEEGHNNVFDGSIIEYANLYIPIASMDIYKKMDPWKNFQNIFAIQSSDYPKCTTPTISIKDGKLKFNCETENVEYVSELSTNDVGNRYTDEVDFSGKIIVKVYATKSGYENSDTAILEIPISIIKGDLNGDGEVNVADHVELSNIILNQK